MKLNSMILLAVMLTGVQASALEPAVSSMVTKATPAAPSTYRQEDDTLFLGITECRGSLGVSTNVSGTFEMNLDPDQEMGGIRRFEAAYFFDVPRNTTTSPSCPENCTLIDETENTNTGADPFFVRAWASFEELTGTTVPDDCTGFDKEFFVEVYLLRQLTDSDTAEKAGVKFIVDTIRPTPPPSFEATVTQNQIEVTWELAPDDDIEKYGVYWSTTEFSGGDIPTSGLSSKFFTAEGDRTNGTAAVTFEPGTTVYLAMVSSDETGNSSVLGNVISVTVIETQDFWDSYQAAGGSETGGCSTAATGSPILWLVGLIGLALRRRR